MSPAISLPCFNSVIFAGRRSPQKKLNNAKVPGATPKLSNTTGFGTSKKEPSWRCVEGCGACCKLAKGPAFATPEEIFTNPTDIELYKSLIGPDGWCIHYEKSTRKCSIYPDRPYFCRVEPDIFESLYGITKKKFNKEACGSCRDTIKEIYGSHSKELDSFNRSLRTLISITSTIGSLCSDIMATSLSSSGLAVFVHAHNLPTSIIVSNATSLAFLAQPDSALC
ncbi:hypothetical protein NC652_017454 [Populus alba x Populus x berolinensis]|nr:hypothetical protein NC652_017454 [Populus alba x Populus x berolinensis]